MTNTHSYSRRGTPVEELLAGPLRSVAQANSAMAADQIRFLLDNCFTKTGDTYRPITINMVLTRSAITPDDKGDNSEITQVSLTFELPLITLIPINTLSVEEASVSFEMEVTSQYALDKEESTNTQDVSKPSHVQLAGNLSYDSKESFTGTEKSHYVKKNNSKIKFDAKVGTLPLPLGLTTVLEAYTKNFSQNGNTK